MRSSLSLEAGKFSENAPLYQEQMYKYCFCRQISSQFEQEKKSSLMSISGQYETRKRYLDALLTRYGTITLPIGSSEHSLPLQTVFQPLKLRHGSFSFEVTARDPQFSIISTQESQRGSSSPELTAQNGAEALARSKRQRMVVLGGPGMGKTTLLKDLLQRAIGHALEDLKAPLPLFLSLANLARSGLTLEAYLPNIIAQLTIETSYASILAEAVVQGRAFLCLDSLNEVVPALRPDMISLINREALRCGGTWVIGSRFTEYKGGQFAYGQFAEWELQPLDQVMRLELARHLFPILADMLHRVPASSPEAFLEALEEDERIASWGENPLLFSLTAIVSVQEGNVAHQSCCSLS